MFQITPGTQLALWYDILLPFQRISNATVVNRMLYVVSINERMLCCLDVYNATVFL